MMHVKDAVNWGPTVQLKRALRCIISANKRPELPTLCCQICWLQPAYFTSVQREVKDVSSGLTPCSLPFIFHLICTTHGCLVSDINTQWKTKLWIPVMYLCSCSHHPLLPRSLRSISYVTLFFSPSGNRFKECKDRRSCCPVVSVYTKIHCMYLYVYF